MRQPFFKIWGHALGRLVLRRDPIDVRLDDVLDAVAESPAAIEINGDPYRLDLEPVHARKAARRGIKFVLSCDAHSTRAIDAVRFAVAMARRARIRRRDVLNALPPDELMAAVRAGDVRQHGDEALRDCPWSQVYVAVKPAAIGGVRLERNEKFALDVGMAGGTFRRRIARLGLITTRA